MPSLTALLARLLPALALLLPAVPYAEPSPRPAKIGLCASCHGDDGRAGAAGVPRLAGQDEQYLRTALLAYRSGARPHDAMRAISGTLSVADIAEFARWYAAAPARP